jgi:hypothetical protein
MPRRAVLSDEQRAALLALPDDETLLVQHWTLSRDDLAIIVRRRRPHNRLGFAIQLCALRYPGRFLRPGELIPDTPLAFVAEQLQVGPEVLADYATRGPTRYEQLDALRDAFGFMPLSRPLRTTLQEWLLPIALTTTSGARLARVMLDECRRRRIIVPGISSVERMVAQALLDAERHVAEHLTRGLDARQRRLLDALLLPHTGTNLSDLAWVRQSPGKPGRKTFAAIIERLTLLRAIGIDPDIAVGVHPERLRRLCQEGVRLTAQHVRTLQATRRRATLVATILETIVTLTDDAVLMFDRLLGQMFRREQNSADTTLKRNRRTINGKIRLLAQLGAALLAAKISGGDIGAAVEAAIGWNDLGREVDEARKLIRPDLVDPVAVAATNYPVLRQVGPSFIASFTFGAVPACHALARAVAIMRDLHFGHLRKLPAGTPVGFIRQAWRRAIGTGIPDRRIYELCVLVELRDRLRAGDMWVEEADAIVLSSSNSFLPRIRQHARGRPCRYRHRIRPISGWPNDAPASPVDWPRSSERRRRTRWKTCSSAWAGCGFRPEGDYSRGIRYRPCAALCASARDPHHRPSCRSRSMDRVQPVLHASAKWPCRG